MIETLIKKKYVQCTYILVINYVIYDKTDMQIDIKKNVLPHINFDYMRHKSKRNTVKKFISIKNEQTCTLELLKIVLEKIERCIGENEKIVDVLLIDKELSFYPDANIEAILCILQYERKFEASIKLNHSYCNCGKYEPPCCRWLTVKNTWDEIVE